MILPASDVASLKSALTFWEWVGYISTAIVFLGCVGEFVAEFTPVRKSAACKDWVSRLSLIVLIAGIAGELVGEVRVSQLSGQITANIEESAGDAALRAGEAEASANNASIAASRANVEAGQAVDKSRKVAEKADFISREADVLSDRLIEEIAVLNAVGPRSVILGRAALDMSKSLSRFAGQKVVVEQCGFLPPTPQNGQFRHADMEYLEKQQTWTSIFQILVSDAKWGGGAVSLKIWNDCMPTRGITAFFNEGASPRTKEAAATLGDALKRVLPLQTPPFLAPGTSEIGLPPIPEEAPWVMIARDPELIVILVGEQPIPHPNTPIPKTANKR